MAYVRRPCWRWRETWQRSPSRVALLPDRAVAVDLEPQPLGQEVDDAFAEFKIEDGMIDAVHLKSLMVAKKDGEDS